MRSQQQLTIDMVSFLKDTGSEPLLAMFFKKLKEIQKGVKELISKALVCYKGMLNLNLCGIQMLCSNDIQVD